MSAGLIKHLRKKTDEDSNTKILMSQWEFDEKLVGKSLENVGSYYPHFSSHNESHSQQILVNIERLLGSNIEKLTATDTWLILEAAYWHDIGMLFNADEVQKVFEDDDFKEYVESLANDNTQDLHEFAKVWHEDGWNKALVNHSDPHTGVEKYRQMIAEWYRRGHAKNSNDIVMKPFEKLNISSPRTELLPKRIYRYLGQICWAHGLGFDDYVMKTLPFRQTGMGTENCHPRFVACLLRLGDLFDIDDNRFCPVMARQVGNMPSFSETHKHKHQAIREFQLDNETVSITAVCSTEMAYIECRNWFNWIREEIQNQMSQWKNIVPSRDFGLLPTINKLDVEMTDKKILLNDKPMKFSLDERSAIELLQGNNLYKDDMSIYRELIQNAIDATMIRVWLEHGIEKSQEPLPPKANPYDESTRKMFEKYPIELDCRKVADFEDSTLWEFSIEDNGIGISRKDLEYMQKIAGSKNNKEKQKIIRQMPEWMQPSGEFGIGLHSAFLLVKDLPVEQQKITIFTKSRLTHESLKIELNSPLSGKSGYCFIEKLQNREGYGTKLVLNIKIMKYEDNTPLNNMEIFFKIKQESMYKYNDGGFYIINTLLDIYNKISHPLFNIRFKNEIKDIIETSIINKKSVKKYYWDENSKSSINISMIESSYSEIDSQIYDLDNDLIDFYYRGQYVCRLPIRRLKEFKKGKLDTIFMNFKIDIYQGKAKELLNISRNSFTKSKIAFEIFEKTFLNLIDESQKDKKLLYSLFESTYAQSFFTKILDIGLKTNLNNNDNEWKSFEIGKDFSLYKLDESECFIFNKNTRVTDIPENTICISSNIIEEIIHTRFMKGILEINNFKTYCNEILFEKHEKHNLENILFSRSEIKLENWNVFNFYEDSYSEELSLEYLYNFNLYELEKGIDYTIERYITKEIYQKLVISEKEEVIEVFNEIKDIIFPFIVHKNKIIEIDNKYIYSLTDIYKIYNFNDFDKLYLRIKEYIIENSKNTSPKWYEYYEKGKEFKPLDLTPLEVLYKPTT
ncbi:hypothetical protein PSYCG_01275 [Psychrobacter sp. G]|uniref:HD domain-containing protein n=1 Tax=Psychrobacter sp. G TaxID=571800 RepID=UPI000354AE45|nr:ATP-binding protein [Psychrobacter sp. G]AGP47835.1 hypothetical protein PSYCG_01275 [Psychrobacter sp. G]